MKALGPYVVVREVSPVAGWRPASGVTGAPTYWVTDRLTGMPALLHQLPAPAPAPDLPYSPALLPFADLVVEGHQAFLVTELPPHTVPARDPWAVAVSALEALDTLHTHGLAHGSIDPGQLWLVGEQVVLVGAGLHRLSAGPSRPGQAPMFTAAGDLRDLAQTLDALGGLPPILSLLRDAPEGLSAQEARQWLVAGGHPQAAQRAARPGKPAAGPAPEVSAEAAVRRAAFSGLAQPPAVGGLGVSGVGGFHFLDSSSVAQTGSFLWQASVIPLETEAVATMPASHPASSVSSSTTSASPEMNPEGFELDIAEWSFPEYLEGGTADGTDASPSGPVAVPVPNLPTDGTNPPPLVMSSKPVVLHWATPNRLPGSTTEITEDGTIARVTESGAVARARPLAEPDPTGSDKAAGLAGLADTPTRPTTATDTDPRTDTPKRRGPGAAAGRALERLRSDATRRRQQAEAAPKTTDTGHETPQERRRREQQAYEQQARRDAEAGYVPLQAADTGAEPAAAPITRRQLKPIRATWAADQKWQVVREGEEAGTGRPLWLLPLLAALGVALLLGLILFLVRPHSPTAQAPACCTVQFALQGPQGTTARLTLIQAPAGVTMPPGKVLGNAPGSIQLPARGKYRIRVSANGFAPAELSVDAPSQTPVPIHLGS